MTLAAVSLDDKYAARSGEVYMTGTQALVRLPMMQHLRDRAAGLDTACLISGYRGSPLGNFDRALWQARPFLERHGVLFQPGVNEDLAATALWGTQQVGLFPGAKQDGVFAIWYGKGPGVDRTMDVFKHANNAGTAAHGGVLALAGDDHVCASSTTAHQSEFDFMSAAMPVLNPAGVQEFLDFGLHGWGLSRYAGLWVGFICIAETVDSSAVVSVDPHRVAIAAPDGEGLPPGGLNIRWPDTPLDQEERLLEHKLDAARAYGRANRLDRAVIDGPGRRLGIVTTGKSYLDVRQALDDLAIDEARAKRLGLALYKVGMSWPLEPDGIRRFASGLDEIVVVEEKRGFIENQIKELLYNVAGEPSGRASSASATRSGRPLLRASGELDPGGVAQVLGARLVRFGADERIAARVALLRTRWGESAAAEPAAIERLPYFCSGCPHNSSTVVPEGSRALAGIGCHYMAQWMDRETATFTHMGGEGASWIGQAPFTETPHIFQNIGDGTYFHSGILAIRAAVSAGVTMTYKILYNDAVAMTGGQPMDGPLTVQRVTRQIQAEGVGRIAVVTDQPEKYPFDGQFADGVTIHHRDELDRVQRELRDWEGVSAIVYDQMCATEKRRRRKRGLLEDPDLRVIINPDVCEGCGDCGVQSNCLSVVPLETEFGRKRTIDQSACNKDFSCLKGFCPSFVLVKGGRRRARASSGAAERPIAALPEPARPSCETPYGILLAGVGGTGIVTLGALLGTAARLEGKGATVLDKAGLAQKYGAVTSHVRIAERAQDLHAVRIAAGGARLLLGVDLVVAASREAVARLDRSTSHAVVNGGRMPTGDFTRAPDLAFPAEQLERVIGAAAAGIDVVDATRMATALIGDAVYANLFLLGVAYQRGLVPLGGDALEQAIALNGVAVEANLRAFRWGRAAAHDRQAVADAVAESDSARADPPAAGLDALIERRAGDLRAYQDTAYASRYRALLGRVREAERARAPGREGLTKAVARAYHKLLAYKDEYEVARLFSDGRFQAQVAAQFDGAVGLRFSLAPPLFAGRDPETGHLKKRLFGPWMLPAFRLLAALKPLRGTPLDLFGYTAERRRERALIGAYEATVEALIAGLGSDNHALAVEIAEVPLAMRGFGHVKEANIACAKEREAELLAAFRAPPAQASAAE